MKKPQEASKQVEDGGELFLLESPGGGWYLLLRDKDGLAFKRWDYSGFSKARKAFDLWKDGIEPTGWDTVAGGSVPE